MLRDRKAKESSSIISVRCQQLVCFAEMLQGKDGALVITARRERQAWEKPQAFAVQG